jgi:hypothetical protein
MVNGVVTEDIGNLGRSTLWRAGEILGGVNDGTLVAWA